MTGGHRPLALVDEPPVHPRLLIVTTVSTTLPFLLPFAAHFRELGWRVDAAANGAPADRRFAGVFDELHDLPLSRSPRDVGAIARGMRTLSGILENGYDLVHVHTPIAGVLTRLAIRRMPAAARPGVVYTAHGFHFHPGGRPVMNLGFLGIEKVAGRWTDRLVVMNEWDFKAAGRNRLVPREHLQYMPGIGVDTGYYARENAAPADTARVRADLGIAPDAPLFIDVGELRPRKRPFDAIAALGRMTRQDAHLLLLGEGPLRPRLEAQVRELGLDGRVHLPGWFADVRPYMVAADALVLASRMEGLPRCIMEALALEVPVITTDCRGGPDLVEPDRGIVVHVGDVDALARAMDVVAADPLAAAESARRGRRYVVEHCDLQVIIGLHEQLYASVLRERNHPGASRLDAARALA
jgi:glycosyltransferase involved in cell wall biosynthesis